MQVNGAPATHALVGNIGQVIGHIRPSRDGTGVVLETTEGMKRRFGSVADAVRWSGASQAEALAIAAADPEPEAKKGKKAA